MLQERRDEQQKEAKSELTNEHSDNRLALLDCQDGAEGIDEALGGAALCRRMLR